MRSEAALSRKIFLQAEGYDILLSIAPVDSRWAVTGQLLATAPAPFITGSAELLSAQDQARAALSELSEFALPPVRAGRYTLTVSLDDLAIVFPDLELGDLVLASPACGVLGAKKVVLQGGLALPDAASV